MSLKNLAAFAAIEAMIKEDVNIFNEQAEFMKKLENSILKTPTQIQTARKTLTGDYVKSFTQLETIDKKFLNVDDVLKTVKTKQFPIIKLCLKHLMNDDEVETVNAFKGWNNQYTVQLVHAVGSKHIEKLENEFDKTKSKIIGAGKANTIKNLLESYKELLFKRSVYVLNSLEDENYGISIEAKQYLKDFETLTERLRKLSFL